MDIILLTFYFFIKFRINNVYVYFYLFWYFFCQTIVGVMTCLVRDSHWLSLKPVIVVRPTYAMVVYSVRCHHATTSLIQFPLNFLTQYHFHFPPIFTVSSSSWREAIFIIKSVKLKTNIAIPCLFLSSNSNTWSHFPVIYLMFSIYLVKYFLTLILSCKRSS